MNLMTLAAFLSMLPTNSEPAQFEVALNISPDEMPYARAMTESAITQLTQETQLREVSVTANYTNSTIHIYIVPHNGPQQLSLTGGTPAPDVVAAPQTDDA